MGLEICWLMTNIACGPEEITKELFYQVTEGSLTDEIPVVTLIQRFLTSGTPAQQDTALAFVGNAIADSKEIAELLLAHLNLIEKIERLL